MKLKKNSDIIKANNQTNKTEPQEAEVSPERNSGEKVLTQSQSGTEPQLSEADESKENNSFSSSEASAPSKATIALSIAKIAASALLAVFSLVILILY